MDWEVASLLMTNAVTAVGWWLEHRSRAAERRDHEAETRAERRSREVEALRAQIRLFVEHGGMQQPPGNQIFMIAGLILSIPKEFDSEVGQMVQEAFKREGSGAEWLFQRAALFARASEPASELVARLERGGYFGLIPTVSELREGGAIFIPGGPG